MEHRYGKRFPADLKTLIFKNGMPVAIGRIHNFSRDGIFVATEFNLIDVNQQIEIELIARDNRASADCGEHKLCKTFVMHKTNGGIGLMLREDCAQTQSNFAAFIATELSRSEHADDSLAAATVRPPTSNIPLSKGPF